MTEDFLDVLIIGAGISGIGCACYLQRERPATRWAILEARDDLGGTWDLFRYPGIRSDSDLYTFGYEFKPWVRPNAIASGAEIMDYLREAAAEYGIERRIRYRHRMIAADWDSRTALWTVTVRGPDGETLSLRARWLFGATGYYDYAAGHRPRFEGEDSFEGPILHPQDWPEGFDPSGLRIAVIGSGATAVTLVPALARTAAHVTQIQRTPSYVLPVPAQDKWANRFRHWLPGELGHRLARQMNIRRQRLSWLFCRKYPRAARWLLRRLNLRFLPEGFDVDTHFNPPYDPWDQRLCIVPDADFFTALGSGRASIVTGPVAAFTPRGVRMESGEEVPADVIVTATGLNLQLFGGADLRVDGAPVDPADRLVFKGMMLDGVPNFAFAVGYTNSSWTLKVGLLCQHFCRLLDLMERKGWAVAVAQRPAGKIRTRPLLDFGAGYVQRSIKRLPRQGEAPPWEMTFDYIEDARLLRRGPVEDPALEFSPPPAARRDAAE